MVAAPDWATPLCSRRSGSRVVEHNTVRYGTGAWTSTRRPASLEYARPAVSRRQRQTEPQVNGSDMNLGNTFRRRLAALTMAMFVTMGVSAQQINGTPGSPSATQVIKGNQIPAPPLPFGGVIKESYKDSKPYWPPTIVPPKGAPNVLHIM